MKIYDYINTSGLQKVAEDFLNVGLGDTYNIYSNTTPVREQRLKGRVTFLQGVHIVGLIFASIATIIFLIIREVGRANMRNVDIQQIQWVLEEPRYNDYEKPINSSFSAFMMKCENEKSPYDKFKDADYCSKLHTFVNGHNTCAQNEKAASIILNIFENIRIMIANNAEDAHYPIDKDEINVAIDSLNKLAEIMKSKVAENENLNSDSCKKLTSQTFDSLSQSISTPKKVEYEEFITMPIEAQISVLKEMVNSTDRNTLLKAKIYLEGIEGNISEINALIETLKTNNENKGFYLACIREMQFLSSEEF